MVEGVANELIGRRLGEFVLREQIGEGGFGMVYRAEQPILEREAVVKIAQVRALGGDPAVQRFLGEARLASRLDHPFAAHVYAFGAEPDGLLWIAMELVRGTPLDAMLAELGPLPLERAIPFLIRLCEVVHTVHEQGVVHRDLKPANVMVVARAGSVFPKLLDLGIAADLRASGTPSGADQRTIGTPLYMAPEMWLDARKAGPPADVYALGALTYEVLAGKPPFTGRSVMEIAALHARKAPPALGEPFPPSIDAAIAKAMAKRIPNRYATALELGEALREASGIALDAVNLPQLDELTRDEVIVHAPQPIAEAVAALDAARTPPQAREALWHVVKTCAQYVGLVALACHVRVAGKPNDPTALEQLRDQGLDAAGWWKLARELSRPFAAIPDAHPMPELIGLFFEDRAVLRTAMEILLDARAKDPGPNASADDLRKFLVGAVSALASALRALKFLQSYRLAVTTESHAEEWMGVRRPARAAITLAASIPKTADRALLVDANGTLVAALELVAQPGPPSPGAAPELFWLDGADRQGQGARLVAMPTRLERRDATAWTKLGLETKRGDATGTEREETVPYRGLMTFTEADAGVFFGREREIEGFVNRLRAMPLIAVVGPSGAGKSSFVRAGVLPALGGDWQSLVARPGPSPLVNLCARIATLDVKLEPAKLLADPAMLGSSLRARARAQGTSLLIVIDQFEELFTLCRDAAEQEAYASALIQAARLDDEAVRVVITLRDDFLVRAAQLAAFRERLAASLQLLTTPVAADLMRILIEPGRRAGYEFEDAELPKEMVREVADQPAALALLSFTAYQLWKFRDREFHQLPRKAYKALGGVGGALAQHAETTLGDMTEPEQKIVREVFRHLVTGDGTRAVLSRAELLQVSGGAAAESAIEQLINARLLVAMESPTGESIEVVHEALLGAWPRVVRWRQEDAEGARLRDQVRVAARQWSERGKPRGLLWRGEALTELRLWRARYPGALTDNEEAFGQASLADAARAQRFRRIALGTVVAGLTVALVIFAKLRSEAEQNRDAAERNQERAVASETVVKQSLVEAHVEQGRRALLEGKPIDSLLFLTEGFKGGADTPAIRFMIGRALEPLDAEVATLRGHTGQLLDIAISPGGTQVVTASDDGSVRVWDAATGAHRKTLTGPKGLMFAQWADDARVIWGGSDGAVSITNVATGGQEALAGNTAALNFMAIDAPRRHVLAGTDAGVVRVWELASKKSVQLGKPAPGTRTLATFSPRGDAIAVSLVDDATGQGGAALWSIAGTKLHDLQGHRAGVIRAVFDASGTKVATASADNTARLFDVKTGRSLHELRGHDQPVRDVAWSPDGTLVATASVDTTIRIWDVKTGEASRTLRGHAAQVNRVRFTADNLLLSAAGDGTAKLWDPRRGQLLATFGHSGYLHTFDLDERSLATASWDGTAKLWQLQRRSSRSLVGDPTSTPYAPPPLITPGGTHAIRHSDKGLEIWSLADGKRTQVATTAPVCGRAIDAAGKRVAFATTAGDVTVSELGTPVSKTWQAGTKLTAIAMAPSGDLVTAGSDGSLIAWTPDGTRRTTGKLAHAATALEYAADGATIVASSLSDDAPPSVTLLGADLQPRKVFQDVYRMALSRDGARIATAHGVIVRVWTTAGREDGELALGSNAIDMVWSPRGDRIFIGGVDGSIEVWSRADKWTREARVVGHSSHISLITISRAGDLVVTSGGDSMVKIWDATTLRQVHGIKAPAGTVGAMLGEPTPEGRWLVATDDTVIDVWNAASSKLDVESLGRIARCRLPFRLEGQVIVPSAPADGC